VGQASKVTFRFIKGLVRLFYPKTTVLGAENLPDAPVIIVGNHCKMNGPIVAELYLPGEHDTWCAGQMMSMKEVPDYAFADFWSEKPRWCRWFYRLLSYVIAPLSVCVFNEANTIGVYHDSRIIHTFKQTLKRLQEGANVVIFPEHGEPYNHILCRFQERFVDVARMYWKKTGEKLQFIPLYLAPKLKTAVLGKPIAYDPSVPPETERHRMCEALMQAITDLACALPEHLVVPYHNVPKRQFTTNLAKEALTHEKTGG